MASNDRLAALSLPRGPERRQAMRALGLKVTARDFTDSERMQQWGLPPLESEPVPSPVTDLADARRLHAVLPVIAAQVPAMREAQFRRLSKQPQLFRAEVMRAYMEGEIHLPEEVLHVFLADPKPSQT